MFTPARFTIAVIVMLPTASLTFAQKSEFRAGAYAQDVTPEKFPVSVNGGFADRKATTANDPLHALSRPRRWQDQNRHCRCR